MVGTSRREDGIIVQSEDNDVLFFSIFLRGNNSC